MSNYIILIPFILSTLPYWCIYVSVSTHTYIASIVYTRVHECVWMCVGGECSVGECWALWLQTIPHYTPYPPHFMPLCDLFRCKIMCSLQDASARILITISWQATDQLERRNSRPPLWTTVGPVATREHPAVSLKLGTSQPPQIINFQLCSFFFSSWRMD